jgi:hypothetical protein
MSKRFLLRLARPFRYKFRYTITPTVRNVKTAFASLSTSLLFKVSVLCLTKPFHEALQGISEDTTGNAEGNISPCKEIINGFANLIIDEYAKQSTETSTKRDVPNGYWILSNNREVK